MYLQTKNPGRSGWACGGCGGVRTHTCMHLITPTNCIPSATWKKLTEINRHTCNKRSLHPLWFNQCITKPQWLAYIFANLRTSRKCLEGDKVKQIDMKSGRKQQQKELQLPFAHLSHLTPRHIIITFLLFYWVLMLRPCHPDSPGLQQVAQA